MARKPEQKMWDALKPALMGAGALYDRIESPMTAPAFPDLFYTWNDHHGLIEMKAHEVKRKTMNTKEQDVVDLTHFTQEQRTWLRRHSKGKRVKLLVRVVWPDEERWYCVSGTLAHALPAKPTVKELTNVSTRTCIGVPTPHWLKGWL